MLMIMGVIRRFAAKQNNARGYPRSTNVCFSCQHTELFGADDQKFDSKGKAQFWYQGFIRLDLVDLLIISSQPKCQTCHGDMPLGRCKYTGLQLVHQAPPRDKINM
jgi:hypothetical protein